MTLLTRQSDPAVAPTRPAATAGLRLAAPRPTLRVDLSAVAANTRRLAAATTGDLMAVVKADAFGHGAEPVARTALAHGATSLGVTGLAEAIGLREAGITAPVLSWLHPADEDFAAATAYDLEIAVPSVEHLDAVARTAPGTRVHLQVDTGLAREGAAPAQWRRLFTRARMHELDGCVEVVGLMSHLPCAGDPFDPSNMRGRARFLLALQLALHAGLRPRARHLAATEATLLDPLSHHTLSRCGAGLVGAAGRLRPAATLTAPVVELRQVRAGTPVGYGLGWTAPQDTTLALLPLGYADGLPRLASAHGEVLVDGVRRPLAGPISMDMTVVDLGDRVAPLGTPVTLFGPGDDGEPTIHDWAAWAQTLPHEIVTGLGPRLLRRHAPWRVR